MNNMKKQPKLSIPIHWAGGKYRLVKTLAKYAPKHFNHYYECFAGSLALLWYLHPKDITINDYNPELTNFYRMLATHYFTPAKVYLNYPNKLYFKPHYTNLRRLLTYLETKNNHDDYYHIRNLDQKPIIQKLTPLEKAGRFCFLDKNGFNGIMRYSHHGYQHGLHENIPWGRHKTCNLITRTMSNDARYLAKSNLQIDTGDFAKSVQNAQSHDFIYADPPYLKRTKEFKSSFTNYTGTGFNLADQKRLADLAIKLTKKHVYIMLSNADVPLVKKLYPSKYFNVHHLKIQTLIAQKNKSRKKTGEVIITNY